jgi:hypothetical protein
MGVFRLFWVAAVVNALMFLYNHTFLFFLEFLMSKLLVLASYIGTDDNALKYP